MNTLIFSTTLENNHKLAEDIKKIAVTLDLSCEILDLEGLHFPLYTPSEQKKGIPQAAKDLSKKLEDAAILIFLAPEYNGSIPPVLVNAITWITVSSDDWRKSFNDKLGFVGTHSGGGGQKVIQAMRTQLEHLGVMLHPRSITVNATKSFNPESATKILTDLKKLSAHI